MNRPYVRFSLALLVIGLLWWLAWPRWAGIPDWLMVLGMQPWLLRLHPIESWLASLGLLLVAVYAIFHENFYKWLRRAKLFAQRDGGLTILPMAVTWKIDDVSGSLNSFQIHLKIKNGGSSVAEDVEVYAQNLEIVEQEHQHTPCNWFLPMNLKWAHQRDEDIYTNIPAGLERPCALAQMFEPEKNYWDRAVRSKPPHEPADFDYTQRVIIMLHTKVESNNKNNWLYPASYKLHLLVASRNSRPRAFEVALSFPGVWADDTFPGTVRFTSDSN